MKVYSALQKAAKDKCWEISSCVAKYKNDISISFYHHLTLRIDSMRVALDSYGFVTDEILNQIFSYLDGHSLKNCLSVCKLWNSLVNNNQLWFKAWSKTHPESVLSERYYPKISYNAIYASSGLRKYPFDAKVLLAFNVGIISEAYKTKSLFFGIIGFIVAIPATAIHCVVTVIDYRKHLSVQNDEHCRCMNCKKMREPASKKGWFTTDLLQIS